MIQLTHDSVKQRRSGSNQRWTARTAERGDFGSDFHAESFQDTLCSIDGDAVVFVAFVARNLRLADFKPLGQLALSHPFGDTECDQQPSHAGEILKLVELAPLEPFVALDFFLELFVEGANRVQHSFDFVLGQVRFAKMPSLLLEPVSLLIQPPYGRFVFRVISNHGYAQL